MKWTAFLLAVLLLPLIAIADGLATSICVLDTPAYERLVKEFGDTAKIPTDVLWKAAVHREFLKDSCDTTFKREGESYRLLASRHGTQGQTIYSISQEVEGKASHLVCVGTVGTNEAKKDLADDPFVVILREGNFLKQ